MDEKQMRYRCPSFKLVGKAKLSGFRLDFTKESKKIWYGGVADIVDGPNCEVWGLLYELTYSDLENLKSHEKDYRLKSVGVMTENGEIKDASAFSVVNKKTFIKPSQKYMHTIIRAAKKFKFPPDYIVFLESVPTNAWKEPQPLSPRSREV